MKTPSTEATKARLSSPRSTERYMHEEMTVRLVVGSLEHEQRILVLTT
ncbi:hypothetical protein ACFLWX_03335 [Chloroflexota bacterium]